MIFCLFYWPGGLYGVCMILTMYKDSTEVNLEWTTFLLFDSFFFFFFYLLSDFKDCQHHESIFFLYSVHNYRALVQHWKVEQRHNSLSALFLLFLSFFFFGFGYSFIVKPQNWSILHLEPLGSHTFSQTVREHVPGCTISWPRICLSLRRDEAISS